MLLIKAMQKLSGSMWNGYFIVKHEVEIKNINNIDVGEEIKFEACIEKSSKHKFMSYVICDCKVMHDGDKIAQLKTTLVKKEKYKNVKNKPISFKNMKFFRVVTREEVEKFCKITGDYNYIHRGEKAVVQAMLMLLLLEDYLAFKKVYMRNCVIRYIRPVIVESKIFLCWKNPMELVGATKDGICFELKFKK
ncbi:MULTISPECIES: hypothetical protein [Clostridium]|uniref:hypothetical protein n=1 Tax=Clostridium TaxID=1485 RepID=UPI0008242410|nr:MULTISPECIES: hypothetical protein [Clostridium]PJI10242.1 hypothetical protein CUB90_21225 [Clostridium sp. CT7]